MRLAASLVSAALAVALAWVAGRADFETPLVQAWVGVTAVLVVVGIAWSLRREGDPFSPLVIVGFGFGVLYLLRPLFILSSGRFGPTTASASLGVDTQTLPLLADTARLAALGAAGFVGAYVLVRRLQPVGRAALARRRTAMGGARHDASIGRLLVAVAVTGALAVAVDVQLVLEAGGVGAYIESLSQRSGFFFGRAYLTVAVLPLKAAFLLLLAQVLRRERISSPLLLTVIGIGLAVMVGDFLTGGRAALLTGTILPAAMLVHYLRRPASLAQVSVLLVVCLALFVAVRVATRDAVYAGQPQSTGALVRTAVSDLPTTVLGGQDAIPFDSLTRLSSPDAQRAPRQWGRTYLPILTYPVPRAVWPSKPLGGGNAYFTQRYFPEFYGPQKTETSISFLGEALVNFGPAGVLGLTFLLGVGCAALYGATARRRSPVLLVVHVVTVGYLVNVLRGDAFHAVTGLGLTLGLVVAVDAVTARPVPGSRRAASWALPAPVSPPASRT